MIQAADFDVGETFSFRGELFTVTRYETDKEGGIINMFVADKLLNEISFNPYACVKAFN